MEREDEEKNARNCNVHEKRHPVDKEIKMQTAEKSNHYQAIVFSLISENEHLFCGR